ncbi:MAG: hypothetical protein EB162_05890 [Euryarchaeota archaeon]|nr:hypothetical protein [Euryarchaeota archaeon]
MELMVGQLNQLAVLIMLNLLQVVVQLSLVVKPQVVMVFNIILLMVQQQYIVLVVEVLFLKLMNH